MITLPDKKTLTFDLWDTAGEEKFRAMARIFLQDAKAVILVYDPTNENTFKELKEYWYNQAKSLNAIIAVVASKCDLSEKKLKKKKEKNLLLVLELFLLLYPLKKILELLLFLKKLVMLLKMKNKYEKNKMGKIIIKIFNIFIK